MQRSIRTRRAAHDELMPEYDLDYSKAKPTPCAARLTGAAVTVVLDPDIAAVFRTSEALNMERKQELAGDDCSPGAID
jgi:hypothetical protein